VPADGFYEWRGEKQDKRPFLIDRRDGAPFAVAGLWERWMPRGDGAGAPVDSFTILTTAANDLLRPLHDRMPVMLPPAAYALCRDPAASSEALMPWLTAAPNEVLRHVPIGQRLNNWREDDAALIEPTGPQTVS
jgi:putative SOS response-associated peptidase YedK